MDDSGELLIDTGFILSIILISIGVGMNWERYIRQNHIMFIVYAAFLLLAYKQLVLERYRETSSPRSGSA